jgi:hypothetical protein
MRPIPSLEVEVEGVEFFEFAFLEMLCHVVIALVWRIPDGE